MAGDGAATGGDGAATAEQGGGEQQQAAQPDLGAFGEQLAGLTASHEQTRAALQGIGDMLAQQQQMGDGEQQDENALDLSQYPEFAYMDDEQRQQAEQGLLTVLSPLVEQNRELRGELDSFKKDLGNFRMEWGARDLVAEVPQLGDGEYAKEVVGLAGQLAEQIGQPELADNPAFWRVAHYALAGQQAANAENGAESPQTARLEGGGGAAPGAAGQETGPYFGGGESRGRLPF
jgi:hypothetical protein